MAATIWPHFGLAAKTTILRHWSIAVHVISKVLWYGAKTGQHWRGWVQAEKWNQQGWITQCTEVGGHGCKGRGNGWGLDWKHPCIDLYHTQQQCNGTRTKLTHRFSGFRSSDARPFQPLQQNVGVEFPNKEDGHAVTLQCRQAQSTTTISISMLAYTCSTHWACATVFHHEVTSGQARNIFFIMLPA